MLSVVNHVANAADVRRQQEHAHREAYRIAMYEAEETKICGWEELDSDTQREITMHRLYFTGLDVVDGDMLNFIAALAGLFSRKAAISDTEAAAAVNHLKEIIYGQMQYFVNQRLEPFYLTGEE